MRFALTRFSLGTEGGESVNEIVPEVPTEQFKGRLLSEDGPRNGNHKLLVKAELEVFN